MSESEPLTRTSLLELLQRSQHLKDDMARLLEESRDLDKVIAAQVKKLSDQAASGYGQGHQN